MSNKENEIVPSQEEQNALMVKTTDVQEKVDVMLANRQYIIEKVKPLLIEGTDIYYLPGDKEKNKKPSLGKPGAEKLAAIFNLTAKFEVDKETMEAIGQVGDGKKYIAYICNLSKSGRIAGQGRGATFIELQRNSYRMIFRDEFEILPEEKKRKCQGPMEGVSKKTGNPYTFWRMPEDPVFDPLALNKAIKMSQKSAFVDAVIRATGMSDLFTQDLEDMHDTQDHHQQNIVDGEFTEKETVKEEPRYEEPFPDHQEAHTGGHSAEAQKKVDELDESMMCDAPGCGGTMMRKNGARGPFLGCSNYKKGCHNTKNV